MADNFSLAQKFTAKWEGGYVNNPKDPGGATNHGVSLRWLNSFGHDVNNDGDINQQDIIDLTADQAAGLFREHFWQAQRLDDLPALVAVCQYDAAVNMGPYQAAKALQRACNSQPGPPLVVDGGFGARTRERVAEICSVPVGELSLAGRMIFQRENFYRSLADGKPDFKSFLKGWLNRSAALWVYVQQLDRGKA